MWMTVAQLKKSRIPIKAVIMVPTYRAAARFIEKTRDLYPRHDLHQCLFRRQHCLSE
jgi:hypothetical protein